MLHLDVPTIAQFQSLADTRADLCVSLYLKTTPLSQEAGAMRTALGNLAKQATAQAEEATLGRGRLAALQEHIDDLIDDEEFWQHQANSLCVLATPDGIKTFRLANHLSEQVEVSDRFHLKPLLRAITFPHLALVLALSENGSRLLEVLPEGPPVEIAVPDFPRDAASAVGKSSINDRSPSGRITGAEGKKVRLAQYARKVDAALRPVLAGLDVPLFLAASEPLASLFHTLSTTPALVPGVIAATADRTANAELADAARKGLDARYAQDIADFATLFATRETQGRARTDIADAARAAAYGAIEQLLVDIDETVPGSFDPETGAVTLADHAGADSYGVLDAIALRALATGAKVYAVRRSDIPGGAHIAAILRYRV